MAVLDAIRTALPDEAMLFRGVTTEDGTEYRDMYADSRTRVTEHAAPVKEKGEE